MRKDLHFLPVDSRIRFKVCQMMHNVVHGSAPTYIKEMIRRRPANARHRLRADDDSTLLENLSHTVTHKVNERRLSIAGPKLWNKLPKNIRDEDSREHFKSLLKTFLFKEAYE